MKEATLVEGPTLPQPRSRPSNIAIGLVGALVIFGAALTLIATFAKKMPTVLTQQFSSAQAADTFMSPLEDGKWEAKEGTYQLSIPVAAAAESTGNTNLSINKTAIKSSKWELETKAKSSADFSVVFDYLSPDEYSYVNFSGQNSAHSNGIFTIENGQQKRLAQLPVTFAENTSYTIEIRKNGAEVKVYSNNKYVTKTNSKNVDNGKVGYGSRGGSLVFDDLIVKSEGGSTHPLTTPPVPSPVTPPSAPALTAPARGGRGVKVSNSEQLAAALADARPGDVITMADATYAASAGAGNVGSQHAPAAFRAITSGTATKPITLQGTRGAIINGNSSHDGTNGGYGLHLFKANYWAIKGIRVTNAKKGIMLDSSNHNILDGVMVDIIGHEGVHFRTNSSYNTLKNSFITKLGYNNPNFGEAVSIGSSDGDWQSLNSGSPDHADTNRIEGNTLSEFTAAGISLREATSNTIIKGNYFDGASIGLDPFSGNKARKLRNAGDSWVDVKGDNNLITENSGVNVPLLSDSSAAFQTHAHGPSGHNSGSNNKFTLNKVLSGNQGYGFWIDINGKGNIISCNNVIASAAKGFSNAEVGSRCKETGN